ncbi:LptF/LptG family permease [Sesbania bispinosa]|nr:LptF/LptG family permease [Sesbania bispinosa]
MVCTTMLLSSGLFLGEGHVEARFAKDVAERTPNSGLHLIYIHPRDQTSRWKWFRSIDDDTNPVEGSQQVVVNIRVLYSKDMTQSLTYLGHILHIKPFKWLSRFPITFHGASRLILWTTSSSEKWKTNMLRPTSEIDTSS